MKIYERLFSEKENLFEMANFWPKDTGLSYVIWISEKSGKEKHGPRIKIDIDGNIYSMTVSDTPEFKQKNVKISSKELNTIKKFIIDNKDLLLKYWNEEISTVDFVKKMKKIKNIQEV